MIVAGGAGAVLVSLAAIVATVNTFWKKPRACQGISPNTKRLSDSAYRTMILVKVGREQSPPFLLTAISW